ncbi:MAG: 5-formyltetrahydrofolate cyclo-ligase [Coriobacteriia bacterium]|nr:5-formyltetrahydrofolate cyclo-ligase [Coriobacteriia bacterium]
MDKALQKQQMRKEALAVRAELSQDVDFILRSTSLIAGQLLSVPEVGAILDQCNAGQACCFASYAPSKGEPNPNGFLDLLESRGRVRPNMAFPRVAGKGKLSMHFALLEDLLPGSFGIPEPGMDMPLVSAEDIAVMLVPGVAFDLQGNRLGYGKGYYDQLLAPLLKKQLKCPLLVGISFEETVFDQLPSESHDIKMDYIITPQKVLGV